MRYQIRRVERNDFMMTVVEKEITWIGKSLCAAKRHCLALQRLNHDKDSNVEYRVEIEK